MKQKSWRWLMIWTLVSFKKKKIVLCFKQQPMRSKHCQTCQHCVRRYDHHCPWIENCVGERNHRWFVFYLAFQLLVLLWGLRIAWWATPPISTSMLLLLLLQSCHILLLSPLQDGFHLRTHLAPVAAYKWSPDGRDHAASAALAHRTVAARLPSIPGFSQHNHVGVHVAPPHLLPQTLRCRWEPLWPRDIPKPLGFLLHLGHSGVGACVLQGGQQSGLGTFQWWTASLDLGLHTK